MSQYKDLDILLKQFEGGEQYKELLKKINKEEFFSVQSWPQVQKKLKRYMIFYLHKSPLLKGWLHVDTEKSYKLPIGLLHYLATDTLQIGYIIELPKSVKLELTPTFINSKVGKVAANVDNIEDLPPLEYVLHNKHLCCYQQQSAQLIACKKPLVNFLL